MDWDIFLARVEQVPNAAHRIRPPCPHERIEKIQSHLGNLPPLLMDMLNRFDGAELFVSAMATFTLFEAASARQDWSWTIERYTSRWRAAGERPTDWVFGITNYGGIFIADSGEAVREWDTQDAMWLQTWNTPEDWADWIIREGTIVVSSA